MCGDQSMPEVTAIRLSIANCYLVKTGTGFILIDTGFSWHRRALQNALRAAGCATGDLKLIVITHGDLDHTGNCVWLQKRYRAPVGMHPAEAESAERGNMFLSRKNGPGLFIRALVSLVGLLFVRRFKPQVLLNEGDVLSAYGLDARILHLPGHSMGSIGVLTAEGQFFCGDLLATKDGRPIKGALVDDAGEMDASIRRLKGLHIKMVYPGHGRPFTMDQLMEDDSRSGH